MAEQRHRTNTGFGTSGIAVCRSRNSISSVHSNLVKTQPEFSHCPRGAGMDGNPRQRSQRPVPGESPRCSRFPSQTPGVSLQADYTGCEIGTNPEAVSSCLAKLADGGNPADLLRRRATPQHELFHLNPKYRYCALNSTKSCSDLTFAGFDSLFSCYYHFAGLPFGSVCNRTSDACSTANPGGLTGMTKQIVKIALGVTVALSALAVPGYSSTLISLTTSTSGGSVTLNGGNPNQVTAITDVLFNDFFTIALGTVAIQQGGVGDGLSMTGTIANPVWTLVGGISSYGIADGTPLLTIDLFSALTNLSGSATLNAGFSSTTQLAGVTGNQTFLDHVLGLSVGTPVSIFGTIQGGSGFEGGTWVTNVPDIVTSEQITLVVSQTPEPASWCLAGVGLLLAGILARRKSIKQA